MLDPALVVSILLGLCCFLVISAGAASLVLMIKGAGHARKQKACGLDDSSTFLLEPGMAPEVAMIAAPPDASEESQAYVRRLLKLHSDNFEVILVLDGPSDSELDTWKQAFHLKPASRLLTSAPEARNIRAMYKSLEPIRLMVVDRAAGGASACLNTGVLIADAPVVGTVGIHAQFSEDALLRLIRPMVNQPERTIAVCGGAPAEPASGMAARLYRLNSVRAWLGRSAGLSVWNSLLPSPGSFLLMKRDRVMSAGGFRYGPVDMIIRLHAAARAKGDPYSISFVPGPASRPVTPGSLKMARALYSHDRTAMRKALGRNVRFFFRHGRLGWMTLPGLLWAYLRPAVKMSVPVLAILAWALGTMETAPLCLLVAVTFSMEILVSMSAVILHEYALQPETEPGELVSLFLSAMPEQLFCGTRANLDTVQRQNTVSARTTVA